MKIYVVVKRDNQFDESEKRATVKKSNHRIFRNRDQAYECAHNEQLEYLQRAYSYDEDLDKDALDAYVRDESETWKVSYGKVKELLDDILDQYKFHDLTSHELFQVEEHNLE
ncbi:hypothetical protein BGZ83_007945 [Gryganskiella cystojenkinii]|nr:hypothetical protein BGZ83_007945 [Gryganskiella cystojenkinii]